MDVDTTIWLHVQLVFEVSIARRESVGKRKLCAQAKYRSLRSILRIIHSLLLDEMMISGIINPITWERNETNGF